jgi:hypothetical protein
MANDTNKWVGKHEQASLLEVVEKESYSIFNALSWNIIHILFFHMNVIKWHGKRFHHVT